MKKLLLCIMALVLLFQGTTKAQLVDVINEPVFTGPAVDPFFGSPLPAGYTAYRIYARLEDATDRVSAVFGSSDPSPTHTLRLWSSLGPNSIYNNLGAGALGDAGNCSLWAFAPAMQWDSYATIGATSSAGDACVDCIGSQGAIFQITSPANVIPASFGSVLFGPDLTVVDGSWFLPNDGSCNGFPQGVDNRVLIAQVTVPTGTLEYWLNIAIFDEAIGANQLIYVHTQEDAPGLVGDIVEIDGNCMGLVFPEPAGCGDVPGCTDPTACNWNPLATTDDGSCTFPGCIDPTACNFDPAAGCQGLAICTFPGCTDPAALNFDPLAGCDDGSCIYLEGCTDPAACNFDPAAVIDDGSCTYPGCNNPAACNFDPAAGCDDGSCILPDGCTDPSANNYDPAALCDDGSCEFGCCNQIGYTYLGGDCATAICAFDSFCCDTSWDSICASEAADEPACAYCLCDVAGCTDPDANNYDPSATIDDGSCVYCCDETSYNDLDSDCAVAICAFDSFCCDTAWDSICISEAAAQPECQDCFCTEVPGCTDGAACNFDPAATIDDDSCVYPGCTDPAACNWDPFAGCDDGSCTYPGCTDPFAINFDPTAGCDDGSCIYDIPGCTDAGACNFNPAATIDDGSCTYPGCTDPTACNYDATAGCDDGSCIDSGCTDPLACNYDATAGCDDGSCVYAPCIPHDVPAGAVAVGTSPLGTCSAITDDLTGASDSPESATVGPDLWYSFTAVTSGVRIEVADPTPQDLTIELFDNAMNPVDLENAVVGTGDEALNIGNLTAGQTYYISVSNGNTGLGLGTFTLCVQWLPDTRCDYGPGPYSLCGTFKADWVGANAYAFHLTSTTTLLTYNKTQPSPAPGTFLVLNTVPGLTWGDTYTVTIGAVWNLNNGAGGTETVEVLGDEPCTIVINPQPVMILRPSDNCANHGPHFLGSTIAGQPFVCGAVDFEWEFTRTDVPELPFTHLRGAANRFLNLNTVPGLVPGATYSVRVRPIFASAPSVYGPADCLSIVGPAGMIADNNGPSVEHELDRTEVDGFDVALYPNPNNGEQINLNLTDITSDVVNVDMFDMFGKLVYSKQYTVDGVLNTIISFDTPLAGGSYNVRITMNGEVRNERMIVQR